MVQPPYNYFILRKLGHKTDPLFPGDGQKRLNSIQDNVLETHRFGVAEPVRLFNLRQGQQVLDKAGQPFRVSEYCIQKLS